MSDFSAGDFIIGGIIGSIIFFFIGIGGAFASFDYNEDTILTLEVLEECSNKCHKNELISNIAVDSRDNAKTFECRCQNGALFIVPLDK
jgi:hypothetical protein